MKMMEWMRIENLDDEAVASMIGDVSASAVKKWKYGERTPRPRYVARITEISLGRVTANDFVVAAQEAAG